MGHCMQINCYFPGLCPATKVPRDTELVALLLQTAKAVPRQHENSTHTVPELHLSKSGYYPCKCHVRQNPKSIRQWSQRCRTPPNWGHFFDQTIDKYWTFWARQPRNLPPHGTKSHRSLCHGDRVCAYTTLKLCTCTMARFKTNRPCWCGIHIDCSPRQHRFRATGVYPTHLHRLSLHTSICCGLK